MRLVKIPIEALKEMKSKGFNELVPYTHTNLLVRWIFWKRLETIIHFSPSAEKVLDFGAGSGVFLPTLSSNFKEVNALDLNTNSLKYVKERFGLDNVKVIQGKESKLPFKDNTFDVIFAADVLEHFHDCEPVLKEFNRVLKNNGHIVISGPTENFIYRLSRRVIFWFFKKKEDHFSNIDQIIKKAEKYFIIERVKVLPSKLIAGFKVFRAKKR
jgi:ubiquinone/menaquinone biosynthesis C-methylase UbiE